MIPLNKYYAFTSADPAKMSSFKNGNGLTVTHLTCVLVESPLVPSVILQNKLAYRVYRHPKIVKLLRSLDVKWKKLIITYTYVNQSVMKLAFTIITGKDLKKTVILNYYNNV